MGKQPVKLTDFIGQELKGFSVQELTEVFMVNDDGRKTKSIGFFKDEVIAKAFAKNQTDVNWHETEKTHVLTNGEIGFLLGESITLIDDEKTALEIREKALAKLSDEEKKVLGL